MSVLPESIEVGKCYLTTTGRVWRVIEFSPEDMVQFRYRTYRSRKTETGRRTRKVWRPSAMPVRAFTETIVREVPCDWTPETDEGNP